MAVARCLVRAAADVNLGADASRTPLSMCVFADNKPLIGLLLEARGDILREAADSSYPVSRTEVVVVD